MEILKIITTLQSYSEDILAYKLDGSFAGAVTEAVSLLVQMGERIAELEEQNQWVPVSERLPDSGVHVLVCCEIRSAGTVYGQYVCDGYYAKRYTEQTWNNSGDIACEYREEDDNFYLLEGWYEIIKNWDDYNSVVIADFVTHWRPLPKPQNKGSANQRRINNVEQKTVY